MTTERKNELCIRLRAYLEQNLDEIRYSISPELLPKQEPAGQAEAETLVGRLRTYLTRRADPETFTAHMLRIIQERGLREADVYNRVFMDRKLFNKIRNDPTYRPSKRTALLIAVALRLSPEETRELIGRAGYVLSSSSKADMIVTYFLESGNYDVLEINEMLAEFGQPLLLRGE